MSEAYLYRLPRDFKLLWSYRWPNLDGHGLRLMKLLCPFVTCRQPYSMPSH